MKDKIDNRMYNKTNIDVSKMTIDKQKERKCAIEQSVACFDRYFRKFFNYANLGAASSGWPHVNHQVAKSFLVARYLNVFVAVSVTRTVSVAVSVSVSTTQFAKLSDFSAQLGRISHGSCPTLCRICVFLLRLLFLLSFFVLLAMIYASPE